MVLCKENWEQVRDVISLTDQLGCQNFFMEPVVTLAFDTEMGKNLSMSEDEVSKAIDEVKKAKKEAKRKEINHNLNSIKEELVNKTNEMDQVIKKDYKENQGDGEKKIENAACFEPWHNLVIRPEGTVGPCCMFDNQGPDIKENSLEKIWFGEYFQNIRQRMLENNLLSFCSKCNPSQVSDNREIRQALQNK